MKSIFVIIFLILPSIALGSNYVVGEGKFNMTIKSIVECQKLGSSSPDLFKCIRHFETEGQNAVNNSYNYLLRNIARDKTQLQNAQEQWKRFAEAQCEFKSRAALAFRNPDRAAEEMKISCMYNLNLERAKYLDAIEFQCSGCVK